jgi:hypothetical protein
MEQVIDDLGVGAVGLDLQLVGSSHVDSNRANALGNANGLHVISSDPIAFSSGFWPGARFKNYSKAATSMSFLQ